MPGRAAGEKRAEDVHSAMSKVPSEPAPRADTIEGHDPIALFLAWFKEAELAEPNDPNAMALATVDAAGAPDVRMVLLKGVDARGFVFYTNLESAKGRAARRPSGSGAVLPLEALRRQVRVRGPVEPVTTAEADAYFATRPKDSQIGAWASRQSRPLEGVSSWKGEVARFAAKYALGAVPRPPHWSGFRVMPLAIEFWRERPFRLHERLCFTRESVSASAWKKTRLFPCLSAGQSGDPHRAPVRGAARARLAGHDEAGAHGALVGPAPLHGRGARIGPAPGRQVAHRQSRGGPPSVRVFRRVPPGRGAAADRADLLLSRLHAVGGVR